MGIVLQTITPGGAVGVNLLDTSRVISNDFMNDATSRKGLTQFILGLPTGIPFIYQSGL
jgi:hypothetical protein